MCYVVPCSVRQCVYQREAGAGCRDQVCARRTHRGCAQAGHNGHQSAPGYPCVQRGDRIDIAAMVSCLKSVLACPPGDRPLQEGAVQELGSQPRVQQPAHPLHGLGLREAARHDTQSPGT